MDFLDPSKPALLHPPALASPGDLGGSEQNCSDAQPQLTVYHDTAQTKARRRRRKKKHKASHKKHRRSARARRSPRFTG